jgi:homoserine O-acetyltransferase
MTKPSVQNSAGIVVTQTANISLPPEGFFTEGGGILKELHIAYESYGNISRDKDNVVFVCHALSGDAHVAGFHTLEDKHPGWWDDMVGPGKGIDTNLYHVICANILGGCKGTTGPSSINPDTGRPYGSQFPAINIRDIVKAHYLLLNHLGIKRIHAVIGASFGGMQVLEWSILYPDAVERCICIASAASLSTQALAFDIVGREVITSDPAWAGGDYYGTGRLPKDGLAAARMIGHITYLSPEIMEAKFGRRKQASKTAERFKTLFEVERYLQYQGEKFVERFDSNSYLHISHAMDAYDLVELYGDLPSAFQKVKSRFLVVALSSDWLFPPEQSLDIANALARAGKSVSYCLLKAPSGHDAFLVDIEHLSRAIKTYMQKEPAPTSHTTRPAKLKDQQRISGMIKPEARVLDLGCGDGDLLAMLASLRNTTGLGVDIDINHLIAAMNLGLDVFHADIDEDLGIIPDNSYDYVVLSQTLQVVRKPRDVLRHMLRIAREGIVSFPNFGCWTNRLRLGLLGRMPKSRELPYEWYDTPNIHLASFRDFMQLCRDDGIQVVKVVPIADSLVGRLLIKLGLSNLGAERVLVKIARS